MALLNPSRIAKFQNRDESQHRKQEKCDRSFDEHRVQHVCESLGQIKDGFDHHRR